MSSITAYTDQELFRLISKGDEEAFTVFFYRYKSQLFHYAYKLTKDPASSEELVQDLFLKLWTSRQGLGEVASPPAYIHRMAKNAGIDYLRHLSVDRKMQQAMMASGNIQDHSTQEDIALGETKRMLNDAVQQLTPAQRQVFYMSRYQGLSYEEIAAELGIARNTVKNHLTASLKIIRDYLSKHYHLVVVLVLTAFMNR